MVIHSFLFQWRINMRCYRGKSLSHSSTWRRLKNAQMKWGEKSVLTSISLYKNKPVPEKWPYHAIPYILFPPHTLRKMAREAKISLQTTVWDLRSNVEVTKSPNSTIRHHLQANKLLKKHARRKHILPSNSIHKGLETSSVDCYWNFGWNQILWSAEA